MSRSIIAYSDPKCLRDLRVGEVAKLDVTIGKWQSDLVSHRRVNVSFKDEK